MSGERTAEASDRTALRRRLERSGLSPRTIAAFFRVPRERYVPPQLRDVAYVDEPQPIGLGQTISQPSLVAKMTDLLELVPTDRVLELGTGSGYQTAILAELVREVFSIELLASLGESAEQRLRSEGYDRIRFRTGDGHGGWPEAAPFDAIVVAASATEVPPALIEQLAPEGRLVLPVGDGLWRLRKDASGAVQQELVERVRFVPLVKSAPPD